jgi:Uma2 family endonuclease
MDRTDRILCVEDIRQCARYREPVVPIHFPEEANVPETTLHLDLRILLYQLLKDYLGTTVTVCSDQFLYYAADDPKQALAPDVFVRLGTHVKYVQSWKTWERGAPEVAVEVVSRSDAPEVPWQEKLSRYHRLGVRELLRFDPMATGADRLRIWDRVEGALVERIVETDRIRSIALPVIWVVGQADDLDPALRIAETSAGEPLVLTQREAREAEARAREAEARARAVAEARILQLEAELRRRGG